VPLDISNHSISRQFPDAIREDTARFHLRNSNGRRERHSGRGTHCWPLQEGGRTDNGKSVWSCRFQRAGSRMIEKFVGVTVSAEFCSPFCTLHRTDRALPEFEGLKIKQGARNKVPEGTGAAPCCHDPYSTERATLFLNTAQIINHGMHVSSGRNSPRT